MYINHDTNNCGQNKKSVSGFQQGQSKEGKGGPVHTELYIGKC